MASRNHRSFVKLPGIRLSTDGSRCRCPRRSSAEKDARALRCWCDSTQERMSLPPARTPATFFVTVNSVRNLGHLSYDGRSAKSSAWRGGAAYVQMCLTCGLEPGRPGFVSKCICMCGLGKPHRGCSSALNGNGDAEGKCRKCGGGRPEMASIGTVEIKVKRPRASYLPWHARPCPKVAADAAVAAVAAVTAAAPTPTPPVADPICSRCFR